MAKEPSTRSLRGLDGLNFLMADVRDGLGPYLALFLKGSQHWGSGAIGVAMATSSIAAAICQIPAGLLVDNYRRKRLLVAISGILVGLGTLTIAVFSGFAAVIGAQIALGAASAIIPPALAALSLGIVGRKRLPARVSRNESFNHGGNFVAALLAGTLGQTYGYRWIFALVCGFAIGSALVAPVIRAEDIDDEVARGGEQDQQPMPIREVLKRRNLLIFLASVMMFHFGNAAMLPMAGQMLAQKHPGSDRLALSACIISAQFVMVGVAFFVGKAIKKGIRSKSIFTLALLILPVRGLLFSVTSTPVGVVAIQLLDGVAAGIFGFIAIVIASELMQGTGRFNLAQGLVALATGLRAGLSNLLSGFVVQRYGYPAGFLFLAVIAMVSLVFFITMMPSSNGDEKS